MRLCSALGARVPRACYITGIISAWKSMPTVQSHRNYLAPQRGNVSYKNLTVINAIL
jgi:hypothetical protein